MKRNNHSKDSVKVTPAERLAVEEAYARGDTVQNLGENPSPYNNSPQTKPLEKSSEASESNNKSVEGRGEDKTADNFHRRKTFYERYHARTYKSWCDGVRQI